MLPAGPTGIVTETAAKFNVPKKVTQLLSGCAIVHSKTGTTLHAGEGDGGEEGTTEGATEGTELGTTVGTADGTANGTAVGDALGSAVGMADGTAVGSAVGSAVGPADGTAVGDALGSAVGTADGTAVGSAVGSAVSTADGTALGVADGLALGRRLGFRVGGAHCSSKLEHPQQLPTPYAFPLQVNDLFWEQKPYSQQASEQVVMLPAETTRLPSCQCKGWPHGLLTENDRTVRPGPNTDG